MPTTTFNIGFGNQGAISKINDAFYNIELYYGEATINKECIEEILNNWNDESVLNKNVDLQGIYSYFEGGELVFSDSDGCEIYLSKEKFVEVFN